MMMLHEHKILGVPKCHCLHTQADIPSIEQNPLRPQLAPPKNMSSPNRGEDSGNRAKQSFAQVVKNV